MPQPHTAIPSCLDWTTKTDNAHLSADGDCYCHKNELYRVQPSCIVEVVSIAPRQNTVIELYRIRDPHSWSSFLNAVLSRSVSEFVDRDLVLQSSANCIRPLMTLGVSCSVPLRRIRSMRKTSRAERRFLPNSIEAAPSRPLSAKLSDSRASWLPVSQSRNPGAMAPEGMTLFKAADMNVSVLPSPGHLPWRGFFLTSLLWL